MKKTIALSFLLIFLIVKIQGQNYQISFAGTGASSSVSSVKVENLTQCTTLNLSGGNILHLISMAGINEYSSNLDNFININPNPMAGSCLIDFRATDQSNTTIELYDISGNRILKINELLSEGNQKYCLYGIKTGIYFLKIESEKFSYFSKILSINETSGTPEIKHIETKNNIDNQNTFSNSEKMMRLKNGKSIIDMQYNTGDILKLTGISGIYSTVFILVPTHTQTVTFNFIDCTDFDGNHYSVIQIGSQTWMAENLRTTKYSNGSALEYYPNASDWTNNYMDYGAYCSYDNTGGNEAIYGYLYNWYACAYILITGWHVPTDAEWTMLTNHLGGVNVAGGKLKEACSNHWYNVNIGATNLSGFTAMPGGTRVPNGSYTDIGQSGIWLSSTYYTDYLGIVWAWVRELNYDNNSVIVGGNYLNSGMSIRLIKD